MDVKYSTASLSCLGLLAGLFAGFALSTPIALPIFCGALTLTLLPRRSATLLATFCLGLWLSQSARAQRLDLQTFAQDRPVVLTGRVIGHAFVDDEQLRLRLRAQVARQGLRVAEGTRTVFVSIALPRHDRDLLISQCRWGAHLRLVGTLRVQEGPYNLGEPSPERFSLWVKSSRFVEVEVPASTWSRVVATARNGVVARLQQWPPELKKSGALVRALLLGERHELDAGWQRAFWRVGLTHVLAISGQHVSLLAALILWSSSAFLPRRRLTLMGLFLIGYLFIIGPQPSAERAVVMGLLALAALRFERPPDAANALALAVSFMVMRDPEILLDLGFQLSAAATFAIVSLAPRLIARTSEPGLLRSAFLVSLSAQIVTLPMLLPLNAVFSPISLLLNLVVWPWLALMLVGSMMWLLLPFEGLAGWIDLATWPIDGLLALPASRWWLYPMALGRFEAVAVALFLLTLLWRLGRGRLWLLLPLALLLAHGDSKRAMVELIVIDVGQGDAIVLRDGRRAVLVDGGGWRSGDLAGRVLLPTLARLGIHQIEAMVMTHADLDHCGGLVGLADYWPISRLIWAADTPVAECSNQLAQRFRQRLVEVRAGSAWQMGEWHFEVLWPSSDSSTLSENDRSLVISARARDFRALLTGDIGRVAELTLVESGVDLSADLLKVAHHGSKSSSDRAFLEAVGARTAVISAGRGNHFGHPHPEVLARLEATGHRVYRTDRDGLLRFEIRDLEAGRTVSQVRVSVSRVAG